MADRATTPRTAPERSVKPSNVRDPSRIPCFGRARLRVQPKAGQDPISLAAGALIVTAAL
jgi:hypothetical protein